MTKPPELIWAKPGYDEWLIGGWDTHGKAGGTEYIRADLVTQRTPDPAVQALVEAAQKARAGLGWAQHHLDEAGMKSLSVDLGIQYIDAALAAFDKTD